MQRRAALRADGRHGRRHSSTGHRLSGLEKYVSPCNRPVSSANSLPAQSVQRGGGSGPAYTVSHRWHPKNRRPSTPQWTRGRGKDLFRAAQRCSDKHRRANPFLLGNQPTPGGLNGRGALGEPGRSRRPAPRARESDALPVMQATRDRRSLGPLARRGRARTPQGAKRPRSTASPGQRGDSVASGRASGPEAREQKSRAPRAFWTPEFLI